MTRRSTAPDETRTKRVARTQATAAAGTAELKAPPRRRPNRWVVRVLLFVTCVVLVDALFGDRGLAQTIRARRDYRQAADALAQMKNQNAALREQIRRLQEDPTTIEAVARRELGLIRPGEILVVVRDVR